MGYCRGLWKLSPVEELQRDYLEHPSGLSQKGQEAGVFFQPPHSSLLKVTPLCLLQGYSSCWSSQTGRDTGEGPWGQEMTS